MKEYTVYFEFFGRKMRTTVKAETEENAKQQIINRINIIRCQTKDPTKANIFSQKEVDFFMDILNGKI